VSFQKHATGVIPRVMDPVPVICYVVMEEFASEKCPMVGKCNSTVRTPEPGVLVELIRDFPRFVIAASARRLFSLFSIDRLIYIYPQYKDDVLCDGSAEEILPMRKISSAIGRDICKRVFSPPHYAVDISRPRLHEK